jgi:tetratricopeptide (TPR) repeat protein
MIFLTHFFLAQFFSQNSDAAWFLEKGTVEFNAEMYSFAEENLHRAVSIDPSLFKAYALLGDIEIKKKHHHEALGFYSKSLIAFEAQDDTHFKAGEIEDYLADRDSALKHFLRSCEINPYNVYAAAGAGRIFSLKGKSADAEKFYLQSQSAGKAAALQSIRMSESALRRKKNREAEDFLLKAIRENPADSGQYYALTALYRKDKRNKKAAETLEKLKFIKPNEEKVYVQLAYLYYSERMYQSRKQEINMAIAYMKTALLMNPENIEYLEFLAELSKAAGKEKGAEKYDSQSRAVK